MNSLPLAGIRVIDLCNVVMGPYATQILAQYGADVIKVEPPGGDDSRRTGASLEEGMASLFLGVNRGKRSIVLDLKSSRDREQLRELIRISDVLVHNIRPQKLAALGITSEEVHSVNPSIVYANLTGFGQEGLYGGRPAYDDVIQGMSGLAALFERSGYGEPRYVPTIIADKTVATMAASAILAAIVKRQKTSMGSVVEVPMFETMVSFTLVEHMHGGHFAGDKKSMGYPRALAPWRKPFRTLDGFICVMPYTDRHWRSLLMSSDRTNLVDDPRFSTIAERSKHTDFVYKTLAEIISERNTTHWTETLNQLQIPAAPINQPEDLMDDPHLLSVGFFQHIQDPLLGDLCFPGAPVLFDGMRPEIGAPPRLGEHTQVVLTDIRESKKSLTDNQREVKDNAALAKTQLNDGGIS